MGAEEKVMNPTGPLGHRWLRDGCWPLGRESTPPYIPPHGLEFASCWVSAWLGFRIEKDGFAWEVLLFGGQGGIVSFGSGGAFVNFLPERRLNDPT